MMPRCTASLFSMELWQAAKDNAIAAGNSHLKGSAHLDYTHRADAAMFA